jgi:two-component system response regulator FlrC
MILQPGQTFHTEDLCFEEMVLSADVTSMPKPLDEDLRSREHSLIVETLRSVAGNRQAAAERLGLSPRTLRYKLARMRELGLVIPGDARETYHTA